jgi:hypothetical protein
MLSTMSSLNKSMRQGFLAVSEEAARKPQEGSTATFQVCLGARKILGAMQKKLRRGSPWSLVKSKDHKHVNANN